MFAPLRLRLVSLAFLVSAGCATGSADPTLPDSSDTDTSVPMDSSVNDAAADARMDAGDAATDAFVFDGTVPPDAALLFASPNRTGTVRVITADVANLGTFMNNAHSLMVPAGYTLYGTTLINYGGDLSDPYIGPITVDDLGALANQWDAIIFRPSSEPTAVVYRDINANPKVYPLGTFNTLGATNDIIDGINLPAGVTLLAYDDQNLSGRESAPYVGPLNVGRLPYRDVWSSLVIRASTAQDVEVGDVRFYKNGTYTGEMLVLTPGYYPNLGAFPGVSSFIESITSVDGRNGLTVFAFDYPDYGGDVFVPLVGDTVQVANNDKWDSIVIQPVTAPTLTVFWDGQTTNPAVYPIVNVSNLQGRSNQIDGVTVPAGYVIHAFSHKYYGGLTGNGYVFGEGNFATAHDDWDSFIVRRTTDPVVTLTFDESPTTRVYPLGSYANLETASDDIIGADVPCGVRILGYVNENYLPASPQEVVGPTNISGITANWSSMVIERTGATCP